MIGERMRRVLVVEDERIVARDLQQTLIGLGYDAFAIASSAEEAIARASETCPDVVLMDIRIKGQRDGIRTAEILKHQFGVPVVYLTAHADEATIDRAKKTEPYGYLLKPVKSAELRSAIEVCLYRYEMEKRLREREQRALQKQLEHAERLASLGTMAASVAHEVNTPLAVIAANSTFVAEELARHRAELGEVALSEAARRRLDAILLALSDVQLAASRIGSITSDLRAFPRPAQRATDVIDVVRCVEWAIRATSRELEPRAQLTTEFGDIPLVEGDEARLGQVFINLLVNAAHAIAPGSVDSNEVSVRAYMDERGFAVVEIGDTGSGISDEVRARIFEPFFTTKAAGVGTGLGLSICHGIVSALGGELRVESALGKGSRFFVLLPGRAKAEAPPEATAAQAEARPSLLRGRMLVIDNEELVLRTMQRILQDHELVVTESALEGLAILELDAGFDVIFSDLMMPRMTGIQFYEALLARNPDLARKVVFLSGGEVTPAADDFLYSIQNPCLEKPFDARRLRQTVQDLLVARAVEQPSVP